MKEPGELDGTGSGAASGKATTLLQKELLRVEGKLQEQHDQNVAAFRALARALDKAIAGLPNGPARLMATQFSKEFVEHMEVKLLGTAKTPKIEKRGKDNEEAPRSRQLPPAPTDDQQVGGDAQANKGKAKATPERPPTIKPKKEKTDDRVLVRLAPESPFWNKSDYQVRTAACEATGLQLTEINGANKTKTGWALHVKTHEQKEAILADYTDELAAALGAEEIEEVHRWIAYAISEVPRNPRSHLGAVPTHPHDVLLEEVLSQTDRQPTSVRPSNKDDGQSDTYTLIATFTKRINKRWRLFGTSRWAREIEQKPVLRQCDTCQDYHPGTACGKTPRCAFCGKAGHNEDDCEGDMQCANCLGPHRADDPTCPARPVRKDGKWNRPTRSQLNAIRNKGAAETRETREREGTTAPPAQEPGSETPPADPPKSGERESAMEIDETPLAEEAPKTPTKVKSTPKKKNGNPRPERGTNE